MGFLVVLIILIVVVIRMEVKKKNDIERAKREVAVEREFQKKNFNASYRVDGSDWTLAYDKEREIFNFVFGWDGRIKKEFKNTDIIQVKLVEDDEISLTSSRSLTGAVVGGMVAGGVGAVIGGTTRAQTQKRSVSSIMLVITLNDYDTPYLQIPFLNRNEPIDVQSQDYQEAYQMAFDWLKLCEVAMNRAS